ncbi:putative tail tape measure protein [Rhizobium phage RHph_X2_30]|nr:putative tail tape measure protein [Rhizobium phage RHph_X2_30]
MAKNEVDLIIKAENQFSKTLKSAVEAFNEFQTILKGTAGDTGKTNTALGQLATQAGALAQKLRSLKSVETIAKSMDELTTSAERSQASVSKMSGDYAKLSQELSQAEKNLGSLKSKLQQEETALQAIKDRTAAAREEKQRFTDQVAAARESLAKYNAELKKTPKAGPAQKSAGVFLRADVDIARAANTASVQTTKAAVQQLGEAATKQAAAVKAAEDAVKAAESQTKKLKTESEKVSRSLKEEQSALEGVNRELTRTRDLSAQVSAASGGAAVTQERITREYAKQATELARVNGQIQELNRAQAVPVATDRRGLLTSRRTFVEAQAEVKRLADEMRKAEAPTEELAAALGRAQARAKLAADAYQANSIALRRTAATQSSLSQFLSRTATAQQQAATQQVRALARANQAAQQGTTANRQLAAATQTTLPPIRQLAQASQATGAATQQAANGATSLRNAFAGIYGESRKSLSLFQRIRGEILALTAGYIGLQAAIGQIRGVINAFQTIEAAQSRLGVVFNQDTSRVANELAFLERNAQRLGISFEVLSNQYSKFAVAADAANFTSTATRDIFLSVAEAGRVNKLSMDQLNGVFLALEQMISKGKVSSEELRRQLGDRLAGAFTIFADAIGVSTAELDEMLRKGEVVADQTNLLKFADELKKRFGPQLAAALQTTTAELGRFQNNIFQAQLRVGEGGFIEAFTNGVRKLNEFFQSREGRDFFLSIGAALAKATQALVSFMPYMDELAKAIGLIALFKVSRFFADMVTSLRTTAAATATANAGLFTWQSTVQAANAKWNAFAASLGVGSSALARVNAQLRVATVVAGTAGTGFLALRIGLNALTTLAGVAAGAFRLLWAAIGGVPGLILTGVTVALGTWLTGVEDTTTALDEHKRIMGEVITSYESVKGKTKEWAQEVRNVTLDQAVANLRTMQANLDKLRQSFLDIDRADFFSANALQRSDPAQFELAKQIRDVRAAYENGTKSAKEFVAELEVLYRQISNDGVRQWAEKLLEAGRGLAEVEKGVGEAALVAKEFGDTTAETNAIVEKTGVTMEKLTEVVDEAGKSLDDAANDKAKKFNEALEEMGKLIPSIADELKRLESIEGLNKQYQDALKLATTMSQVMGLTDQYKNALGGIIDASFSGTGSLVDRIIGVESGGNASAQNGSSTATGLGQFIESTWLRMFKKYFPDRAAGLSDAMILELRKNATVSREMVALLVQENAKALQQAGVALTDPNLYLAHFLGSADATKVLRAPRGTALQGLVSDSSIAANPSVLGGGKTVDDIIAWAQKKVGVSQEELAIERELAEQATKRTEKAKEYNTDLENRLSLQENENSNEGRLTQEAFIQKRLAEEKKKAEEANVTLSAEQIDRIKRVAAEEWKVTQAKRDQKTEIKDANTALQQAQALEQQRNALMQQYKQAVATGDATAQESLKSQITTLNQEIVTAAENARAMWEAIGGPEAAAKLPILDALIVKAKTAGNQIGIVGRQTNSLGLTANQTQQLVGSFADGLVGVFDNFAQAVANGENAFQALGSAFLQFAANFLREIATMILKQMILNALAGFGGPIGQAAGALGGVAVAHGGGVVGSTVRSRMVNPGIFSVASYYHGGGVAGLKSNEVPAILERGETIRTEAQEEALQERMAAGQGGGAGNMTIRNVVTLDEDSARNWLTSSSGEQAIWSVLGRDKAKLRSLTAK